MEKVKYNSGDVVLLVDKLEDENGKTVLPKLNQRLVDSLGRTVTIKQWCFTGQIEGEPVEVYRVEEWNDRDYFLTDNYIVGYASPFAKLVGQTNVVLVLKNNQECIVDDNKLVNEELDTIVEDVKEYDDNFNHSTEDLNIMQIYKASDDYLFDKKELIWERKEEN